MLFYAAVALLIFAAVNRRKAAKKRKAGTIVVSGDLKEKEPTITGTKTGPAVAVDTAVQIYRYEARVSGWCCPNCQCENDPRHSNCCVCNYKI